MGGSRTGSPLTLESSKFDFFRKREGRCIFVKGPRLGFGHVSPCESTHHERLFPAERAADDDGVAGPDVPVWFCGRPIDVDLAAAARFLRFGAGFEEACDVEPDVEALELTHRESTLPDVKTRVAHPVLKAEGVTKTFAGADAPVEALRGVTLSIAEGEFIAVVGPSGCGKSTLLHISGAMDRPTSGRIAVGGQFLDELDDDGLTDLRRRKIGFVFQFFNLLPTLTVLENIALPLLLTGVAPAAAAAEARLVSERVALSGRVTHFPRQLSGGEAQRVAIARAIVHRPLLVIADEPTGNLDSVTGAQVLHLLSELNRERGVTVLLATHSAPVAGAAGRVVHMRDGSVEDDGGGGG